METLIDDRSINTEINKLKARVTQLQDEQDKKRLQIADAERKIADLEKQKKLLAEQSRYITLKVTDHALLRFLERELKYDLEAIRAKIVTDLEERVILSFGTGNLDYNGGKMIIENFLVKTYIKNEADI